MSHYVEDPALWRDSPGGYWVFASASDMNRMTEAMQGCPEHVEWAISSNRCNMLFTWAVSGNPDAEQFEKRFAIYEKEVRILIEKTLQLFHARKRWCERHLGYLGGSEEDDAE